MRLSALCIALAVVGLVGGPLAAQEVVWQAGQDDGSNADFVQEDGQSNPPPGDPNARDDDWYLPGVYPDPVGDLPDGSPLTGTLERAFVPSDNFIRLHFNLPADLEGSDLFVFTTEPLNLDDRAEIPDARYGMNVTFNDVEIMPLTVYGPDDLNIPVSSDPFTASSVGAEGGPGFDNVISLNGTAFNNEGGGSWMGFDFHRLEQVEAAAVPAMTELGLLALALAMIPIGAFILRRRQAATA